MRRQSLVATPLMALLLLAIWLAVKPTRPPVSHHIGCKSIAVLGDDFINPAQHGTTTLTVRDSPGNGDVPVFDSGEYVGLRMFVSGSRTFASNYIGVRMGILTEPITTVDTFGVVTSYADQADGSQTWTFTRSNVDTTDSLKAGACR